MKVDRESGIIERVSVITVGEAKGHEMWVDERSLQMVKELADQFENGVKVKANHYSGVQDIIGSLKNFAIEGAQLFADLHLFKSHSDFNFYLDIAEEIPDTLGLSIAFSGGVEYIGDRLYIRPTELYSIDLVSEPAANPSGLLSAFQCGSNVIKFSKIEQPPAPSVDTKAQDMADNQLLENIKAELSIVSARFETKLGEVTAELASANNKIAELQSAQKSSAEQAQQILASVGQPPVALAKQGSDETPEAIVQHFQKLHGAERAAFFRKNEAVIKSFSMKGKK